MRCNPRTRRQFGSGLLIAVGIGLAGCTDDENGDAEDEELGDDPEEGDETDEMDDDGAGEDDADDGADDDDGLEDDDMEEEFEEDEDEEPRISIRLENEDGEPIASGATVEVTHEDGNPSYTLVLNQMDPEDIDEGTVEVEVAEAGTYRIVVSSDEDEFEPVEAEVTVDEEQIEGEEAVSVTIELDGATPVDDEEEEED